MPKGAVDELAQEPGHDFPVVIANMPASAAEQRVAFALIVFLFIVFVMVTPFASVPLPRVDAFIPVIQTVVCVAELVTAILLFAQYSIQPQPGLLALASGYIFSGLFAFLQTLAFPGAYAPNGLIGDPLISTVYLFCLWHLALPTAVLVYALSPDTGRQHWQIDKDHNRHHYRIRVGCYRCPDVDGDSGRKIPSPHVRGWDAAGPYHQLYDRFYMAVQRRRTFSVV